MSLESCSGCFYGVGNQEAHMECGCLSDYDEKVRTYYDAANLEIDRDRVTSCVYKVMKWLKMPNLQYASIATDAVMFFCGDYKSSMIDTLIKKPLDHAHATLFAHLFPVNKTDVPQDELL